MLSSIIQVSPLPHHLTPPLPSLTQHDYADPDKRIHALEALKHQLEQPDASIEALDRDRDLVQALKPRLKSSNSLVSNHALAALEPYFAALGREHRTLKYALTQLVPWEKLADAKPATRTSAARVVIAAAHAALLQLHSDASSAAAPWTLIEAGLKENGFASKNARAREQAVHILATLRANNSTHNTLPPLRPFTPLLLPLLADADPNVRSAALDSTIRIFTDPAVSDAARADLKKEMQRVGVAPKIQDQILAQVLGGVRQSLDRSLSSSGGGGATSPSSATTTASAVHSSHAPVGDALGPSNDYNAASASTSLPGGAALTPSAPTSTSAPDLAPVYIASERDLDAEFTAMRAGFEGRETEHNWTARDRSVARMRGMIAGGVTGRGDLCEAFVRNVRDVQEGIIKTVCLHNFLPKEARCATSMPRLTRSLSRSILAGFLSPDDRRPLGPLAHLGTRSHPAPLTHDRAPPRPFPLTLPVRRWTDEKNSRGRVTSDRHDLARTFESSPPDDPARRRAPKRKDGFGSAIWGTARRDPLARHALDALENRPRFERRY